MATARRTYRVFLSHAAADSWVARQLRRAMIEHGAAVFLDETSIAIGADFEQKIRQSLRRSNELVVLLTPWSLERHYVWVEIGAAWGMGMPIIAVLYGVTPRQLAEMPNTPTLLKRRNLIELNDVDHYLVQLKKRVQDALG